MKTAMKAAQNPAGASSHIVSLEFQNDAFGVVKALQLFAAINCLPHQFNVSKSDDDSGWFVVIVVEADIRVERVLAKIQSMPALVDFKRTAAPFALAKIEMPHLMPARIKSVQTL